MKKIQLTEEEFDNNLDNYKALSEYFNILLKGVAEPKELKLSIRMLISKLDKIVANLTKIKKSQLGEDLTNPQTKAEIIESLHKAKDSGDTKKINELLDKLSNFDYEL